LPVGTNWYYFWSGQPVPGEATTLTVPIADTEEAVFIREGSIIPLLNFELGRMSLLEAIDDPINLLVYPHVVDQLATGDLYLDEGENNQYLQKERTEVRFDWNGASLSVTKTLTDDNMYAKASGKFINKA
jgi:alpha-glucosidase (family GH31 glycosyl hydrolase)